jgi:hypothetical protein
MLYAIAIGERLSADRIAPCTSLMTATSDLFHV